jgi:hypothetical protein
MAVGEDEHFLVDEVQLVWPISSHLYKLLQNFATLLYMRQEVVCELRSLKASCMHSYSFSQSDFFRVESFILVVVLAINFRRIFDGSNWVLAFTMTLHRIIIAFRHRS